MLKVYYLPVELVRGVERIKGAEFISQAIVECTEEPGVRKVIINQNPNLARLALKVEEPTPEDIAAFKSPVI